MKTITITIDDNKANILTNDSIDRKDFKLIMYLLINTYGNQPGIKRTVEEKMAARKEILDKNIIK
jgi:hypothetical protein